MTRRLLLVPVVVCPIAAAAWISGMAWPIATTAWSLVAPRRVTENDEADVFG